MKPTNLLPYLASLLIICAAASAATADVYVFNNEFSINPPGQPLNKHAVITTGDTIRWVRVQGNHTTTSVAGSPEQWDAPINNQNPEFSYTFNNEGIFVYYCIPHGTDNGDGTASGMWGSVTVLAANQTGTVPIYCDCSGVPTFNTQSQPSNTRPEPLNSRSEPFNTRPEPLNSRSEPFNTRPEPINSRSEPFNTRPEPLNSRSDPCITRSKAFISLSEAST